MSLLNSIFLLPLIAALVLVLIPGNYRFVIRSIALLATLASAVQAVRLFLAFDPAMSGYQFQESAPWAPVLGIQYRAGVDGVNLGLVLMGAIVLFAATCVSREITRRDKEYYILLLLMGGGILGAFVSLDLVFFYVLHELALVPTFILMGVWGHGEKKTYATYQITLYLSLGALVALAGLLALYLQLPPAERTFDLVRITSHFEAAVMPAATQRAIFPLLLFGFGILVSLWPFHTWAPLGYGSAPTAAAMLHAGVIKKFGLYGLIRVALPVLPEGAKAWMPVLAWLCLGNIVYCGWVAMRQRRFDLLLGNSSVAHVGFAFLGIASLSLVGVTGTVLVMVAHGFLAALLFGLAGHLRQQRGEVDMTALGGLAKPMPFFSLALVMGLFAGCGLPGFANFPGELLVMFGAWQELRWFVVAAAWGGLVIGALYALRAIRQILHGPVTRSDTEPRDIRGWWRKLPFAALLACLLIFGVQPQHLVGPAQDAVAGILKCRPPEIKKPAAPNKAVWPPASTRRNRP